MKRTRPTTADRQNNPGRDCACFNLRKATRVVTRIYDEALKPAGIRATQFTALSATRSAGPISVNRLAERIVMDRTTLTRNLKPLERDGLISLRPGDDLRVREVSITAKGRKTLDRAIPLWESVQATVRARLGNSRMDQLLFDLRATVETLQSSSE